MSDYKPVMQSDFEESLRQIEQYLQQLMDRITKLEKAQKTARSAAKDD